MVQRVQILFDDDLEAAPAEETVNFGLDNRDYETDSSVTSVEKLRRALRQFVAAARKPTNEGRRTGVSRATGSNAAETAIIGA